MLLAGNKARSTKGYMTRKFHSTQEEIAAWETLTIQFLSGKRSKDRLRGHRRTNGWALMQGGATTSITRRGLEEVEDKPERI